MASDFEKPDKVHTLFKDEIASKLWPLDVKELFPYISTEYANKLFLHLVEINDEKVNLVHLAPYVDNSILSVVVDKYINGELSDLKINNIYPFLKEEDITRLFNHYMKTNE